MALRRIRRGTVLAGVVLGGVLAMGVGIGEAQAQAPACSTIVTGVYLCSQPLPGGGTFQWVSQSDSGHPITAGAGYGVYCINGQQTLYPDIVLNDSLTQLPVNLGQSC